MHTRIHTRIYSIYTCYIYVHANYVHTHTPTPTPTPTPTHTHTHTHTHNMYIYGPQFPLASPAERPRPQAVKYFEIVYYLKSSGIVLQVTGTL